MVKDVDLYISVPSLFRCPISLDVMKSPVSLCTGVTYDRSSIQRWLDGGNNTCPATMQVLQTKDLVPNHTLQRLIQIWSDSVKTRRAATTTTTIAADPNSSPCLTQAQAKIHVQYLIHSLRKDPVNIDNYDKQLRELVVFCKESDDENRTTFLLPFWHELLPLLVSLIDDSNNNSNKQVLKNIDFFEQVLRLSVAVLQQHYRTNAPQPSYKFGIGSGFLSVICKCLREGNYKLEFKILATKLMFLIANADSAAKNLMSECVEIYSDLLGFMVSAEWDQEAMEAALSCLECFTLVKRRIREKLVRAGAVGVLSKALSEGELSVSVTEKALKLLEMASSCKEGRAQMCENEVCIQAIVKKVLKVSNGATETAVTILWCLCCLFRDQKAQDGVTTSNGMAKILLLMQSNCTAAVRQMCSDLLKVFRVNSKISSSSFLSTYDTKTTHIMPF